MGQVREVMGEVCEVMGQVLPTELTFPGPPGGQAGWVGFSSGGRSSGCSLWAWPSFAVWVYLVSF